MALQKWPSGLQLQGEVDDGGLSSYVEWNLTSRVHESVSQTSLTDRHIACVSKTIQVFWQQARVLIQEGLYKISFLCLCSLYVCVYGGMTINTGLSFFFLASPVFMDIIYRSQGHSV